MLPRLNDETALTIMLALYITADSDMNAQFISELAETLSEKLDDATVEFAAIKGIFLAKSILGCENN